MRCVSAARRGVGCRRIARAGARVCMRDVGGRARRRVAACSWARSWHRPTEPSRRDSTGTSMPRSPSRISRQVGRRSNMHAATSYNALQRAAPHGNEGRYARFECRTVRDVTHVTNAPRHVSHVAQRTAAHGCMAACFVSRLQVTNVHGCMAACSAARFAWLPRCALHGSRALRHRLLQRRGLRVPREHLALRDVLRQGQVDAGIAAAHRRHNG